MSAPAAPFRAGSPAAAGLGPRSMVPAFTPPYVLLADVSEYQPDVADAAYLAWSKAIVIRAAYGTAADAAWYGGQRRADLHAGGAQFIGIYQFLTAGDGAAQAQALHGMAGGVQPGEVLVADFETGTKPVLTAWYNEMLSLGYPAACLWTYTGLNFGAAQGALPVQWLADYASAEPGSGHKLWQFTDSFAVPGVGTADCSVFHGTIAQLAALAYQPPAPPVPKPLPAPGGLRQSLRSAGSVVTFTWAATAGQTSCHFQVEADKPVTGWTVTVDEQVTGTQYTATLPPSASYRWRVAAGLSDHVWSGWTEFSTP